MDCPSGLLTVHDDVNITKLAPDQCTTVQELTEPSNNYAFDPPDSVHSDDATASPMSDSPLGDDYETGPSGNIINNTQPGRALNYGPFVADGSHHSGIPYFLPQNRNLSDLGVKNRDYLATPSPLPRSMNYNMNYSTSGIDQYGNTSGVQVQPQSDHLLPTPQVSGHLRPAYLQPASMNQAAASAQMQNLYQVMRDRRLEHAQPTSIQTRTYPSQPPMLPSETASTWSNRGNCNGFPWRPSVVPNPQLGHHSYPAAAQDDYALPREETISMPPPLPTPPPAPFQDFVAGNPSPSEPMPQATFYNPKNKYMETENLVEYNGTVLTRREICLIVALERYLHLDAGTITQILKFHRHDYKTHIDLTGFIDWALAYPDETHTPTSKTERDYQAARRQEATRPVTRMIVDCVDSAAGFWAKQAALAHQMWHRGMAEVLRRMRAEGAMDKSGNIRKEISLQAIFQQQQQKRQQQRQQQQQEAPSQQDRGRTMLQTPNETRHPSVQHASTPRNRAKVHESPTAAKAAKQRGAVQKRQKSQTPSSSAAARRRSTATTAAGVATPKERKKTGTRASKKDHSRTASKETVGHSRNTSESDSRAVSATHSRTLSKEHLNQLREGVIDPAVLGHRLESVIQEEDENEEVEPEGGGDTMMGTPLMATDASPPAPQHVAGVEEVNFEDWMEQEGSDGKEGGSDHSEYVP